MGVNSLPKTGTRQRRGCYLNPGPSAPESSTLITRLPSHPFEYVLYLPHVVDFWPTVEPFNKVLLNLGLFISYLASQESAISK